jgi:phospho-N-acetylmuramoyl-pentapeptide-transferase
MLSLVLVSLALTVLLGAPLLSFLRRINAVQTISEFVPETHRAKQGTPTMGGLMIVGAVLILLALALFAGWPPTGETSRCAAWVFSGLVVGFALIGFLDDYVLPRLRGSRGLGRLPKLVLQFVVAVPLCWVYFSARADWGLDAAGAAVFASIVIVGLANAVNLTDGLDGLAAGVMALAALGLWLGGSSVLTSGLLVGTCLGFLFYNSAPARVFMGDVGSLPLGAAFGFALLDVPRVSLWTILLCGVLLVELIPVPIQIASVKLFRRRVFLRTPIHHAFEHRGVPERKVLAGFLVAQGLCTLGYVVLVR